MREPIDQQAVPKSEYLFRELSTFEKFSIPRFLKGEQLDLTKALMAESELRPTGLLQIDGKEFLVGRIIRHATETKR